jgi:L-alanine-DL-glutamate epimerase-like enolase superfamily enzyme
VRAVLAHGLLGRGDAGAVDQADQLAELEGGCHGGLAVGFLAHVALDEHAADLLGDGFALFSLHVGDHHLAAVGGQHARRTLAEARGATGHDKNLAVDLHKSLLR